MELEYFLSYINKLVKERRIKVVQLDYFAPPTPTLVGIAIVYDFPIFYFNPREYYGFGAGEKIELLDDEGQKDNE